MKIQGIKIIFFSCLSLFARVGLSQTQVQDSYISKIIPPSPNAAALGKYGDIPVSYYSGLPSIEIPLYTITTGDLSLPVSLSYHAGGIRMNEEAGWTGLGWSLNAGGMVSRTINDQDDLAWGYFTTQVPEMLQRTTVSTAVMNTSFDYPNNYFSMSGIEYDWDGPVQGNFMANDIEADVFNYNFNGHSGKFSFKRNQEILFEKKADVLVQVLPSSQGFTVTDEGGVKYIFGDREFSEAGSFGQQMVTAWYLTTIISPKGDSIKFSYTTDQLTLLPRISVVKRLGCDAQLVTQSAPDNTIHTEKYLTKITYKNGHVDLVYDSTRHDHQGTNNGKKLIELKVYNFSDPIPTKTYVFTYSYFNEDLDYLYKRLRLDKVTEKGKDGSSLPSHEFIYKDVSQGLRNETAKNSYSIDHWGYFNARYNNEIVPKFTGPVSYGGSSNVLQQLFVNLSGADRSTNPEESDIFTLKEIKYPIGGRTQFDFESNDYDVEKSRTLIYQNSIPPDVEELELVDKEVPIQVFQTGTTNGTVDLTKKFGPNVDLTITFRCSLNDGCATVKQNFNTGLIYFTIFGITRDLMGGLLECTPNGPICTTTINNLPVASGSYPWTAFISPTIAGFQDIYVYVRWKEPKVIQPTYINDEHFLYCGGLRVKKITNYSESGAVASVRNFDYHVKEDRDNNGSVETYSTGRRMAPPSYFRNEISTIMNNGHEDRCPVFARYSSSVTPINSAQGNIIGYDKVTEYVSDMSGTMINGKTVYEFENQPDSLISYRFPCPPEGYTEILCGLSMKKPGIRNLGYPRNGLMKSKTDYVKQGTAYVKVKETFNYYGNKDKVTLYNLTYEQFPGGSGGNAFLTFVYPAFRSEKIQLDSMVEKTYHQLNPAQFLVSSTKYFYESTLHLQPTKVLSLRSEGNQVEQRNYYSLDNISGLTSQAIAAKDNLVTRHIISPVLQSESIRNGQTSVVRTNYKIFSNGLPLPESVETKIGTAPFDKRAVFIDYDSRGNLLSQSKYSDLPVTYQWGYNATYPVAEFINAKTNEVYFNGFEEDGNSTSDDAHTGRLSKTNGFSKLLEELSSATDYYLTFWQKQGNDWVLQTQTVSLNAGTTSHQINLTGQVDDVRFYPQKSQIKTYTYEPGIGITSVTDTNNVTQYFRFDNFGRLETIRDAKKNIVQKYSYQYRQ